jgi:branched-chain amino acid transport system ATP-binding protein
MLALEHVYSYYANREALNDLNLRVSQGEIVAIIGSNGSGKSTTLRTICGLVHAASGRVLHANVDITHLHAHAIARRGIALVPEGRRIFSHLTVLENLQMGAFCRNEPRAVRRDLEYVLERFSRLKERIRQVGGTLSGGEQQMLAIARALMSRPTLLLLDEPSMGLAPLLVRETYAVIRAMQQDGLTILLVEQNAHMALSVADRAYVMSGGSVLRSGEAAQLRDDPAIVESYLGKTAR